MSPPLEIRRGLYASINHDTVPAALMTDIQQNVLWSKKLQVRLRAPCSSNPARGMAATPLAHCAVRGAFATGCRFRRLLHSA